VSRLKVVPNDCCPWMVVIQFTDGETDVEYYLTRTEAMEAGETALADDLKSFVIVARIERQS
jgi:hypothetical protein